MNINFEYENFSTDSVIKYMSLLLNKEFLQRARNTSPNFATRLPALCSVRIVRHEIRTFMFPANLPGYYVLQYFKFSMETRQITDQTP